MRRLVLVAVASALLAGGAWAATAVGSATDGRGRFTDDDGSVHEPDINGLGASEVTKGCNPPANTQFCPERSVSRAEMASFLVRALGLPLVDDAAFTDTGGNVHEANIRALAGAGITKGCNPPANTQFCPERSVSRAEMASFLVRALGLPPVDAAGFTDTGGNVHEANIRALASASITKGCNPPANTHYCPQDPVTRAQMASFLGRALDSIDPILNRLSMRTGTRCTKEGLSCSGRVSLARGIQLEVIEGWYQVAPYLSGEETAFKASDTNVTFTWDDATLSPSFLGLNEASTPATRTWRVRPPALTPGTHTLRALWRWQGATTQTVTYVIAVP